MDLISSLLGVGAYFPFVATCEPIVHPKLKVVNFPSGEAKRKKRQLSECNIDCIKQLAVLPITSKGEGVEFAIKILFQPYLIPGETIKCMPKVIVHKPAKAERPKKKSNTDPFELWMGFEGAMEWNEKKECFCFLSKLIRAKTTNSTIYELLIEVIFNDEKHRYSFPLAIPSRADQVENFIVKMIKYHQTKLQEQGVVREEAWRCFEPLLRNTCISYLGMSDIHLDRFALRQGFERYNGG